MKVPKVYFFDMDFTLQDNDSDVSWKQFLMKEGLASANTMDKVKVYCEQYQRCELQVDEFIQFQLAEFVDKTPADMFPLLERHFELYSQPKIFPEARKLVEKCRFTGGKLAILTSTNYCISDPMGRHLEMDEVLACNPEVKGGKYTGLLADEYSAGPAKVKYAADYCRRLGLNLSQAAYFGDGIYDRYILDSVGFPAAVNPDSALRELALRHGWKIIDFKSDVSAKVF